MLHTNPPNEQDATFYFNQGKTHYDQKNYPQALSDFTRAIELGFKDPQTYANRGNAYYNQKLFDQAIADYNTAIKLGFKDPRIYVVRGNIFYKMSFTRAAIADYNTAIELSFDLRNTIFLRGFAYNRQKELGKAIQDFVQGMELDLSDNERKKYADAISSIRLNTLENIQTFSNKDELKLLDKLLKLEPESRNLFLKDETNLQKAEERRDALADQFEIKRTGKYLHMIYLRNTNTFFGVSPFPKEIINLIASKAADYLPKDVAFDITQNKKCRLI